MVWFRGRGVVPKAKSINPILTGLFESKFLLGGGGSIWPPPPPPPFRSPQNFASWMSNTCKEYRYDFFLGRKQFIVPAERSSWGDYETGSVRVCVSVRAQNVKVCFFSVISLPILILFVLSDRAWCGLQNFYTEFWNSLIIQIYANLSKSMKNATSLSFLGQFWFCLFYLIGLGAGFKTSTQNFEIH